jgi:hypothetical protein
MRLHGHVRVQMVQSSVRFLASVPSALVHPLDLFVSPPRALVLLCARNWDERIHRREWVAALLNVSVQTLNAQQNAPPTGGGLGIVCATMPGAPPPDVAGEWPYIGCG